MPSSRGSRGKTKSSNSLYIPDEHDALLAATTSHLPDWGGDPAESDVEGQMLVFRAEPLESDYGSVADVKPKYPLWQMLLSHVGLLVAQFAFAGLYVFTKVSFNDQKALDARVFVSARLFLGVPVLWICALFLDGLKREDEGVPRAGSRLRQILAGLRPPKTKLGVALTVLLGLNIVTNQSLDAGGVRAGPSGAVIAGLVQPIIPVLITSLGMLLGREQLGWAKGVGALLCIAGGLVMLKVWDPPTDTGDSSGEGSDLFATILLLIMAVGVAVAITLTNELMRLVLHPITTTAYAMTAGWCFSLVSVLVFQQDFSQLLDLDLMGKLAILYCGVVPTSVSYIVISFAVTRVGVAVLSLYFLLQPVITALLAWLLLGEAVYAYQIIGGAVAGLGLAIAAVYQLQEKPVSDAVHHEAPLTRVFRRCIPIFSNKIVM